MGKDKNSNKSDRIVWVDNLKGLLLILTCSSHFSGKQWPLDDILGLSTTVYVPIFVVLSGYLCKPLKPGMTVWGGQIALVRRKTKTLLIPYFFFSIIAFVHGVVMHHDVNQMLYQMLYRGSSCGISTPMYFVSVLFVTSVLFSWIAWCSYRHNKVFWIIAIIGLIVIRSITYDTKILLPWHLKDLPFWGALYITGYLMRLVEIDRNKFVNMLLPMKSIGVLNYVAVNGIIFLGAHNFLNIYFKEFLNICGIEIEGWSLFVFTFIFVYAILYMIVVPIMNTCLYYIIGKQKTNWRDNYYLR